MYILYSEKLNKYYIGACTNFERRLYEHNIGHSAFTSTGIPWVLVYNEEYETLQEAKKVFRSCALFLNHIKPVATHQTHPLNHLLLR